MIRRLIKTTVAAFGTLVIPIVSAQHYDIVIKNGRVMDPEKKFDQIANVGISNGWITKITTEDITGKETVDATGHVVTAGFIDTHTQQRQVLEWATRESTGTK